MGANAQTSVPTFTTGQVLTAAQQNESARTGVPVFATTGTRDAAFGGTGEKTLAEGQLAYVEGTGLQSYNGTSWITWGAAPSSGALTLISATTIGSGVSSVTVSSAFSSTYDNYKITVSGGTCSTDVNLNLQLGSTTTGYYSAQGRVYYSSGNATNDGRDNQASFIQIGFANTVNINMNVDLFGPNLANETTYYGWNVDCRSAGASGVAAGFLNNTTQYTAFTIAPGSGTLTGGTIRVYGYANS